MPQFIRLPCHPSKRCGYDTKEKHFRRIRQSRLGGGILSAHVQRRLAVIRIRTLSGAQHLEPTSHVQCRQSTITTKSWCGGRRTFCALLQIDLHPHILGNFRDWQGLSRGHCLMTAIDLAVGTSASFLQVGPFHMRQLQGSVERDGTYRRTSVAVSPPSLAPRNGLFLL